MGQQREPLNAPETSMTVCKHWATCMKSEGEQKKKKFFCRCRELNGTDRGLRGAMGRSKIRCLGVKGRWEAEVGQRDLPLSSAVRQPQLYSWAVFPTAANSSTTLHSCCWSGAWWGESKTVLWVSLEHNGATLCKRWWHHRGRHRKVSDGITSPEREREQLSLCKLLNTAFAVCKVFLDEYDSTLQSLRSRCWEKNNNKKKF